MAQKVLKFPRKAQDNKPFNYVAISSYQDIKRCQLNHKSGRNKEVIAFETISFCLLQRAQGNHHTEVLSSNLGIQKSIALLSQVAF